MSDENTTTSFRTAKDRERTDKAAATVARMREAVTAAAANVATAEAACVADPDAKGAFEKARAASKALDDAQVDLARATAIAAAVESEIAEVELANIEREIARLEAGRGLFGEVDDSTRELAVEAGLILGQLYAAIAPRRAARVAVQPEIDALLRRIGLPSPSFEDDTSAIFAELAGLVCAAHGEQPGLFPMLTQQGRDLGAYEKYAGQAEQIAARVKARRGALERKVAGAAGAVKLAAVAGIGVLAALASHG